VLFRLNYRVWHTPIEISKFGSPYSE